MLNKIRYKMKKILLSLLLAGGVQNSLAMQAGGAASSSNTQPALSEVSKQLFEAAKNKGYFKFLTTMPQLACNTLKDHPKTAAATGFFAASCAAYYLYNKFNKSSLSQQPGEMDLINAAKNGTEPICPAEIGHRSNSVSAIANIAYQLGRPLTWNPEKEKFKKDKEANELLLPRFREGWKL